MSTLVWRAGNRQTPAMALDKLADDAEPQPKTVVVAGEPAIDLAKWPNWKPSGLS